MTNQSEGEERTTSEQLKEDPVVREALEENKTQESGKNAPVVNSSTKSNIWAFIIIFLIATALYLFIRSSIHPLDNRYVPLLQNISAGIALAMVLLIINQLIRRFLRNRVENPVTQYNLKRVADLVVALLIIFIAISIIFSNWYTVIVSLGLISLILGLALQNPIISFFGWVYILIRKPYKVGDRIKIGSVTGDVIALSYFDTTLWEFRGDYLSSDHPSGRIIRFANNKVFSEYIINYSWPLFPYIWNELNFFVSYDSNLQYVSDTIKQIIHDDMGKEMEERVELYRSILRETPVDELEVRARGSVGFKANNNAWLEVVVRFLVEPKQSGAVKGRLFKKIMLSLRTEQGKVRLPNSITR